MRVVLQDGALRPDGRVELDADDLALQRGVGVFETLRTHCGAIPHLELHLARLSDSAAGLQVPLPDLALLRAEVGRAVALLGEEATVRITLTAGGSRLVQAWPVPAPPAAVRVATRPYPAHPWLSGRVKHISRAVGVAALREAAVDEVLWVDAAGDLLEGTWSNVFAVKEGALCTPADDGRILAGITRLHLLRAARALGLTVREGPVPAADGWEELYLSSSLKLLVPVVELDGAAAPGAGPVGRAVVGWLRAQRGGAWGEHGAS